MNTSYEKSGVFDNLPFNPTGENFEYYPEGYSIPGYNLQILQYNWTAELMRDTRYFVLHLCCGTQAILTHKQINERIRFGKVECPHCAAVAESEMPVKKHKQRRAIDIPDDYGPERATPPSWPVPLSVFEDIKKNGWRFF